MVDGKTVAPDRGDIVWVTLDPTRGHEQRGRRPALVVSLKEYNERIGLALICPITSRLKGYIFEVPLTLAGTPSVVLSDHIRSIDWKERAVERMTKAPSAVVRGVQENIKKILSQ